MTEYVIRAETAITALSKAGETLSDGLLIAAIVKGLPEISEPFAIHVSQSEDKMTFAEFNTQLCRYKDGENMRTTASEDTIMKVQFGTQHAPDGAKEIRALCVKNALPEVTLPGPVRINSGAV